jgi:hypothetical protein
MYHNSEIRESIKLGLIQANIRVREDREDIEQECWLELHALSGEVVDIEDAQETIRRTIDKMRKRQSRQSKHESETEIDERMGAT